MHWSFRSAIAAGMAVSWMSDEFVADSEKAGGRPEAHLPFSLTCHRYGVPAGTSIGQPWIGVEVIPPGFPLAIILARHRRRHNLCPTCGYDLTGNVSGRCSECGEAVEPAADGGRGS